MKTLDLRPRTLTTHPRHRWTKDNRCEACGMLRTITLRDYVYFLADGTRVGTCCGPCPMKKP